MKTVHILTVITLFLVSSINGSHQLTIEEATIDDFQAAFAEEKLTSRQLVSFYLDRIEALNPVLRCVIEVNPDALDQADNADVERKENGGGGGSSLLHGIPVLLKDSVGTKDKTNTTCGSYALLGSEVARDAFVVAKLREAGAVILGKASQSEMYHLRSSRIPDGWCARSGQAVDPYVQGANPGGSSTGSAISVAANMVAVSLGTETDSSMICPADHNSVVAIKPTVGLTSRAGVIPVSPRQDSIGPMSRTVTDAVYVLDAIVGFDPRDYEATLEAAKFIPAGGYKQFLKSDGLRGKRLGIVRSPFLDSVNDSIAISVFNHHLEVFRKGGATVVDDLEIANLDVILDPSQNGELKLLLAEFKITMNNYLEELVKSPVRSLADIIAFNGNNSELEHTDSYGQELLVAADMTSGIGKDEMETVKFLDKLSEEGFERLMKEHDLDVLVTHGSDAATIMAKGGYPAITVPAGYSATGMPFGICFGGLKGTEPKLIEVAYAFEQVTMARKPPPSFSTESNPKLLSESVRLSLPHDEPTFQTF